MLGQKSKVLISNRGVFVFNFPFFPSWNTVPSWWDIQLAPKHTHTIYLKLCLKKLTAVYHTQHEKSSDLRKNSIHTSLLPRLKLHSCYLLARIFWKGGIRMIKCRNLFLQLNPLWDKKKSKKKKERKKPIPHIQVKRRKRNDCSFCFSFAS